LEVKRRRSDFADKIENHGNLHITINKIIEASAWQDDAWSKLQQDYSTLKEDHASQFESVTRLIQGLEESLSSLAEESKSKFNTLEMLKQVHDFKSRLAQVDSKSKSCITAANWLDINRNELIDIACQGLFDNQFKFRKSTHVEISQLGYSQFRQDLDIYLKWISHYLKLSMNPRKFRNDLVFLPIEYGFYQQAFGLIVNSEPISNADISDEAYTMLVSYINRFLIDREL
jgi:hypothetical protein